VLNLMEGGLHGLGASWGDITITNIYTVHDVNALLASQILPVWSAPDSTALHGTMRVRP
jgi:hypothetical protein